MGLPCSPINCPLVTNSGIAPWMPVASHLFLEQFLPHLPASTMNTPADNGAEERKQQRGCASSSLDPTAPAPRGHLTLSAGVSHCPLGAAASLGFPALRDLDILSRPGPVCGGCPSGWARLGSSGDWTGCGCGESPPGAGEEVCPFLGSQN